MKQQHTEGPWTVNHIAPHFITAFEGAHIATVDSYVTDDVEANARLIAAAPELLEALQHAKTCVPFPSDCHDKITAAIAKATGEK